jgi:hypothetical protein
MLVFLKWRIKLCSCFLAISNNVVLIKLTVLIILSCSHKGERDTSCIPLRFCFKLAHKNAIKYENRGLLDFLTTPLNNLPKNLKDPQPEVSKTMNVCSLWQICAQQRAYVLVQAVRQDVQAELDLVHSPPHTLGHQALPVPVLRKEVPPEVGHEEAHLHTHRSEMVQNTSQNEVYYFFVV